MFSALQLHNAPNPNGSCECFSFSIRTRKKYWDHYLHHYCFFFFGFHLTTKRHWFTLVANLCVFFCCWIGGQRCARTVVHSLIRFLSIFAFRRDSHPIYCCTDNIVQVNNFEIIGSSSMHFTDNTSFHQTAHTYTHAHSIYQFVVHSYFEIQIVQRFKMRSCLFHYMHEFMLHCFRCSDLHSNFIPKHTF